MKHLLIAILLLSVIGNASAQKPRKWIKLHGPNVGGNTSLFWGANNEIILPTLNGYLSSKNLGASWDSLRIISKEIYNQDTYGVFVASAAGPYYFLVVFAHGNIDSEVVGLYQSTDGGTSWNHLLKNIPGSNIIEGGDGSLLFGGANSLYKSIDNGKSWSQFSNIQWNYGFLVGCGKKYAFIQSTYYGNFYKYSFDNQSTTLLGGSHEGTVDFKDFLMVDDTHLIAHNDSLLFITNGEDHWTSLGKLGYRILSIAKGIGNILLAEIYPDANSKPVIISSKDLGITWDTVARIDNILVTGSGPFPINYTHPDNLLLEDADALHLSIDNGNSWSEIGFPFGQISQVLKGPDKIFAAYNYTITISSDNGNSWEANTVKDSKILGNGIGGVPIVLANNIVSIYDSTLSDPWRKRSILELANGWTASGTPLIMSDREKYIYVANGRLIYRSDDTAFSWININAPDIGVNISSIDASSDGALYFGTSPIMYRSEDHGATWTKLEPIRDIVQLSYIKTFDKDGVILGTQGDGLLLSTDKGNSWTRIDGNNFDTVTCIAINSKGEIAAGTNRGLWTSDATKQQWTKVTLGSDADLYIGGIDVAANDDFYVGTYGSSVWMGTRNYNSAGGSPITNSSMTIFPNPSSEKITIELHLPDEENARVELYDILGRKISVLAEGSYLGEKEINFNASNLSDGLYSVRLVYNGKTETQKIVVAH